MNMKEAELATARLLEVMDRLRAECPWDREQTFDSLRNNTIEETYELADAITDKNMEGIKEELAWFKEHGIIVRILNVPTTLTDYKGQEWLFDMVNNILIEVLGTIAEQEWNKTKERREEGIAAMPIVDGRRVSSKTGRGFGREAKELDLTLQEGETITEACKRLGIDRSTYYRRMRAV